MASLDFAGPQTVEPTQDGYYFYYRVFKPFQRGFFQGFGRLARELVV